MVCSRSDCPSRSTRARPRASGVGGTTSPAPEATPTFGGLQRKGETAEFNPDYTDVRRDLKRIGILAAAMFATLVVLALVIR